MNNRQHHSQERKDAHRQGQRKVKHRCTCGMLLVGNAAWWSHRNANPDHRGEESV